MSCPFNKESLAQLKTFTTLCQTRPELLNLPDLSFFKEFIETLGGNIPAPKTNKTEMPPPPQQQTPEESDEELPDIDAPDTTTDAESDLELDTEGCVEPDELDDMQRMGDPDKEPTEEESDKADEIRRQAVSAFNEGNFQQAIDLYSNAIETDPKLAILYTKRGQAYLKLKKPNACIKDCTHALELNCDSAPAYKYRGRAHRLIGKWEEAAKDLRQACKIDFDEEADEWLKEVQPNAIKIEQHKIKQERKRIDKEQVDRAERVRKAKEAHAKAAEQSQKQKGDHDEPPTMPSAAAGGAGAQGMPVGMDDFMKLMQDPEIMTAFKDPEVAKAFQDISANPANIIKYQSNPKVAALISKLTSKLGDGGMPGMPSFMGGMGGMGMDAGTAPPAQDDGLD